MDQLCAAAAELIGDRPGTVALRAWMESFVDFMAAKRGLGETLRAVLTSEDDKQRTRDQLRTAIAVLLAAGEADGGVRPGIDPNDLLMSPGGITLIAAEEGRRDVASRLLDLLLDGVRSR